MEPFENQPQTDTQAAAPQADAQAPVPQTDLPASAPEMAEAQPVLPEAPEQTSTAPEVDASQSSAPKKKPSPYANSPYIVQPRATEDNWYPPQPPKAPVKPEKPPKKKGPFLKAAGAFLLVAGMVVGGCLITAASVNRYWESRTQDTVSALTDQMEFLQKQLESAALPGSAPVILPSDGSAMAPSQLYAACVDSVVAISSTIPGDGFYYSGGSASGSGFILSQDGYVVTNYHVIEGASAVSVTLHNADEYPAQVVGFDATNDLAVLKVEVEGLPAAKLGSSERMNIGDMVVAIGNPLGELTATQTVGYVSGIKRAVTTSDTLISMIQTDAAINPGNSGGPLFNMYGEVVGITTAKYSGTTGSGASIEGIGFAIPIDDVRSAIDSLVEYGYVSTAYLGVTVTDTDAAAAELYNLPTGAYVISVEPGYSAQRAGVQEKDIIIDLGGTTVSNRLELVRALRSFAPGDSTTITVIRGGKELTLNITLDERPLDLDSTVTLPEDDMPSEGNFEDWYDYFRRYFG